MLVYEVKFSGYLPRSEIAGLCTPWSSVTAKYTQTSGSSLLIVVRYDLFGVWNPSQFCVSLVTHNKI